MNVAKFEFKIQNATYPACINFKDDSTLELSVQRFPVDFRIVTNYQTQTKYESQDECLNLAYDSALQELKFAISIQDSSRLGKAYIQSCCQTIETILENMQAHSSLICSRLERLSVLGKFSIKTLTHSQATLKIPMSSGDCFLTTKMDSNKKLQVVCKPSLLTTQLLDYYYAMKVDFSYEELIESICVNAEFQVILDDVLFKMGSYINKPYVRGSYKLSGLSCIPNSFQEIQICYKKEFLISLLVRKEPTTYEILDIGNLCSNVSPIENFVHCVHHAVTLNKLPNNVSTAPGSEKVYQLLELYKPIHVHNSLVFILNYMIVVFTLEKSIQTLKESSEKIGYGTPNLKKDCLQKKVLLSEIGKFKFDICLKPYPIPDSDFLDITIDLEVKNATDKEKPRLLSFREVFQRYYKQKVLPLYKAYAQVLFGFLKSLLSPPGTYTMLKDLMEVEYSQELSIEVVWSSFGVHKQEINVPVRLWFKNNFIDLTFEIKCQTNQSYAHISVKELSPSFSVNFRNASNPVEILRHLSSFQFHDVKKHLRTPGN